MKTEKIVVENLKCEDCAITIKNKIAEMADIADVQVDFEKHLVCISHSSDVSRESFSDMLHSIGYPEVPR